jgi:pyridoxal phosphate enzyme (YggS family)
VERLAAAREAGLTTFGENRVQEAAEKAAALAGCTWQLIGHLQSNKAARAVAVFDEIQSVDSLDLARRLARLARQAGRTRLPIYLQVNTDQDPAKAGFSTERIAADIAELVSLDTLELRGLMTIGLDVTNPADSRPTFTRLRAVSEMLRADHPGLGAGLSMGMSNDFEVAVEEGATVVRLGSAIFGPRPSG